MKLIIGRKKSTEYNSLDKEKAIKELLKIMKLNSKIKTIQKFIERIHK